jgi:hypothetical protein
MIPKIYQNIKPINPDQLSELGSKTPANKPAFAAKRLVGKEDLAPYFKHQEGTQFTPAAVALAVITIFMITKSGRDSIDSQLPLDLKDIQVSGQDVDQLLHIRQASLLGKKIICN